MNVSPTDRVHTQKGTRQTPEHDSAADPAVNLQEAHNCLNDLNGLLNHEDIPKKQSVYIAKLEGELEATKNIEDYVQGLIATETQSYVSATSRNRNVNQDNNVRLRSNSKRSRSRKRDDHVLLVYPKEDTEQTSEEVKEQLTKYINPGKLKVGIKNVKKISKGGVLIETTKKEDLKIIEEAIKENRKLKDSVDTRKPQKLNPRIIIYNVKEDITKEKLKRLIKSQNTGFEESNTEVLYPMKARFGNHWVITTDPETYQRMMRQKKVNLQWTRNNVCEYIKVTQCSKCLGFNHNAKNCQKEKICAGCGSGKHEAKDCPKKEKTCSNCTKANDRYHTCHNTKHDTRSKDCPCYYRELRLLTQRINYR
ncbi:uncharacterized protein LOC118189516 [Stegodyphus dumicola]|uniref:uncharacterized protein LOC118189516 n=1 Tax=Stegodyphus dumicola TaxID=202533 RepID=UPI0015B2331F|nr:uncharacterized protein LOC118189516 [Stegodyphus dumicola]